MSIVERLGQFRVVIRRQDRSVEYLQIREQIERYYQKGQELYLKLAKDTVVPEDVQRFVADEWVKPVTDYLKSTLGMRKAFYFLRVVPEPQPDADSVAKFGYEKAIARARIRSRLERLRNFSAELHPGIYR